jgi:hypothetical protein
MPPPNQAIAYQYHEQTPRQTTCDVSIHIEDKDCLVAAQAIAAQHGSVCVLNMANQFLVGGDYLNLSRPAQEESLILRTNLLDSLTQLEGVKPGNPCNPYHYDLDSCLGFSNTHQRSGFGEFTCLYSSNITVSSPDSFMINVISSAAYNLSDTSTHPEPDLYSAGTVLKIINQLRTAKAHNQRHLVLGAFGCGAFNNAPDFIAHIYRSALDEFEFIGCFDTISFAIMQRQSNEQLLIFRSIFSQPTRMPLAAILSTTSETQALNPTLKDRVAPFFNIQTSEELAYRASQLIEREINTLLSTSNTSKKMFLLELLEQINASPESTSITIEQNLASSNLSMHYPSPRFINIKPSFILRLEQLLSWYTIPDSNQTLQTLLMVHYQALDDHMKVENPQHFIDELSDHILETTAERPLPDCHTLSASPKVNILLQSLIQARKEIFLATLAHVTTDLQAEQDYFTTTGRSNPNTLNNLRDILLSQPLILYQDRYSLREKIGITWQAFTKNLTATSETHLVALFRDALAELISYAYIRINSHEELHTKRPTKTHFIQLAKASLQLHSKRCVEEMAQTHGPVHMIHFYESAASNHEPHRPCSSRAAEYLDTFDSDEEAEIDRAFSFDKTSHGLGSGVYGLGALTDEQIDEQLSRESNFKIFEIQFPLRLIDLHGRDESDLFTEVSKNLQRTCDCITLLRHQSKREKAQYMPNASREDVVDIFFSLPEHLENLHEQARILCQFQNIMTSLDEMKDILLNAVQEFFSHADAKKSFIVPMPINYVLKKLGFTGVVSARNDRFNRGLVAIELDVDVDVSQTLSFMPVKPLTPQANPSRARSMTSPWGGQLTPTTIGPSPTLFQTRAASAPTLPLPHLTEEGSASAFNASTSCSTW